MGRDKPQISLEENDLARAHTELNQLHEECASLFKRITRMFTRKTFELDAYHSGADFSSIVNQHQLNTGRINLLTDKLNQYNIPTNLRRKWISFLIKHQVIGARLDLNASNNQGFASAKKALNGALNALNNNIQLLNFFEDPLLTDSVHFLLVFQSAHIGSEDSPLTSDALNKLSYQFCEKAPPSYSCLSLLENMMREPSAGDAFRENACSERRSLFWQIYKKLNLELEQKLERDESSLQFALEYAMANLHAYTFSQYYYVYKTFKIQLIQYPNLFNIRKTHNADNKALYAYAEHDNYLLQEFIYPALAAVAKTNADNVNWSLEIFTLVKEFNTIFANVHRGFSTVYDAWARQNTSTKCPFGDPLLRIGNLVHHEMINKISNILAHPALYGVLASLLDLDSAGAGVIQESFRLNVANQQISSTFEYMKMRAVHFLESEQIEAKKISEQRQHSLLEWENQRSQNAICYIHKKVSKKLSKKQIKQKKAAIPSIAVEDKTEDDRAQFGQIETANKQLVKAFQDMHGHRIKPAIDAFQQAFKYATDTGNTQEQLDSLDGQLFLLASSTSKNLDKMLHTIQSRMTISEPLPPTKRNDFFLTLTDSKKNLVVLSKTYQEFIAFIKSQAVLNIIGSNPVVSEGIKNTQRIIPNFISDISFKINKLRAQYHALEELIDISLTQLIDKIGFEKFREIGLIKDSKGLPKSERTLERRFFNNLWSVFDELPGLANAIAEQTPASTTHIKVSITPEIAEVFNEFTPFSSRCRLRGSRAIDAVSQALHLNYPSLILKTTDIDLLAPKEVEQHLIHHLKFQHSGFQSALYVRKTKVPVDCRLLDMNKEDWLEKENENSDFTIDTVSIDKDGVATLSAQAVQDIKDRILRPINDDFANQIKRDPVILLRAIRFKLARFKLVPEIENAITAFTGFDAFHQDHLYAVTRKYLRTLNCQAYVQQLHDAGLLQKMFGISCGEAKVDDVTIWKLKKLIGYDFSYKPKHQSFFEGELEPFSASKVNQHNNHHNSHESQGEIISFMPI